MDISGLEHFKYKPGVEYIKIGGKYLLDQNPNTNSKFAYAVKTGHKIAWEMAEPPVPGKLVYTGKVMVDGKLMTKEEAYEAIK